MSLRPALLAATCLTLPLLLAQPRDAAAQTVSGPYIGAGAGINLWHDQSNRGLRVHDRDVGVGGVVNLGWGFGNGFRAELEGNYRQSEIETVTAAGAGRIGSSGYIQQYGAMANVLFDFDLSSFGIAPNGMMPYLGGGVGYLWRDISNARLAAGGSSYRVDDTSGAFAYQAIAGISWGLGGMVPGLSFTTEYRYVGALDSSNDIDRTGGAGSPAVPGKLKFGAENHSVLFGLRYVFNAPRPAPAVVEQAPQPPVTARTYLVFFDWDRADLTDRARQIIGEAAAAAPQVQTTRIEVAGHADRSGTPQYNQRLSQRRADAVAAELVRRGIARNLIAVSAYGETRPLVPTADGVREPQNRRVEIVLK
ncbi:OmpA family protein [Siccirubricoccus sp. KC 17139]|uniref:OmpA family protein n=1 Tax=Siccirubricoccus soli TaxID=2899147 RepID=A0ABT1DBX3_9PROT|nr:OmpA family protein [Siccirubricoccus soli]MCO6419436.1 OmpA family protein [Siccirubricoccus soli]MCP2685571.1 OmpA family protein [Siccirubricoccus soli]